MFSLLRARPTDHLCLFPGNHLMKKGIKMAEPNLNEYILVTRKNYFSDDKEGRMVEKSFLEIQGTFLVKLRDNVFNGIIGESAFEHIENFLEIVRPLKIKDTEDDEDYDLAEIFMIDGNLFDFETPLCKTFNEFNYILRIDTDLFTFDIQEIKNYEEHKYKVNNDITGDLEKPWSDNRVPYQLCDHMSKSYCFKNGKSKWPTCSSDIDGFCNGGELPGMNYGINDTDNTQDDPGLREQHPTHDPSVCRARLGILTFLIGGCDGAHDLRAEIDDYEAVSDQGPIYDWDAPRRI
uniref:Uncharacterized protein n=1 Tax=Tanacetum cinerariifolium TaxID=118510 RepID=A0A6L2N2F0_TANCI|nr:hypothetical protein [Tanacetum cinerariifolium]